MRALATALLVSFLVACGGGGGGGATPAPPATAQMVGEIFSTPSEIGTAEIRSGFGYAGNLPTSSAIQAAGKQNILDLLFMTRGAVAGDRLQGRLAPNVEQQLAQYASDNRALLVPGIRVLVADEVYWNPPDQDDSTPVLQRQLDALAQAVALVRKYIPLASVGVTATPYSSFGRPNTVAFIRKAIALVDWVGTDAYWLGDPATVPALHAWSRDFPALAKAANPRVETWYIAQAFRLPSWDLATFRAFIGEELGYAQAYDGVLFFGWQFASELDAQSIGAKFDADTKRLYQRYLVSP
ncbi:MAG: hypothetical protein HYX47_19560 [Burkholderiales bacterium]|nr:hypothetical protein [Burkholderiales bacterium]